MQDSTQLQTFESSLTASEKRALTLLGQGVIPEQAAAASGLSPSRISQLLSQEDFAARVAELRFEALSKHNERDASYDSLEDSLLEKMKDCIPMMVRPQEILRAIQIINQAKRRGSSAPSAITEQTTIVQLVMPTQILTKFQINSDNQVVQAGDQPLVTIQSGTLLNQIKEKRDVQSGLTKALQAAGRNVTAEDF